MEPATEAGKSSSFDDLKRQSIQRRLNQLHREYQAVSDALEVESNPSTAERLARQLEQLEGRIQELEAQRPPLTPGLPETPPGRSEGDSSRIDSTQPDLRNLLAQQYYRDPDIERVLSTAGLDLSMIAWDERPVNTWFSALAVARDQGKLNALFAVILDEKGGNDTLRSAIDSYR